MIVLKPIVWNDRGYLEPAGKVSGKGFPGEHGYGHEEWNARPDWTWNGWKIFHTEAKGRMLNHAANGELGIIMTAMNEGRFYAVGVACNVYLNSDEERKKIADDLGLISNARQLWSLESVRERHSSRAKFNRHWNESYCWVRWRCPATHFHWFASPVEIFPDALIPNPPGEGPRLAIVKMFSSYQAIRNDQALAVIADEIGADHPIAAWLRDPNFDKAAVSKKIGRAPPPRSPYRPIPNRGNSAATASETYRRYLLEKEVIVTPRHDVLQKAFEAFLKGNGARGITPNVGGVDVRFKDRKRGLVFAEIKPAEAATVRFAIRAAIGQLLDYRQKDGSRPELLIVLEIEPTRSDDLTLALDNGFGLAWPEEDGFKIVWP